MKLENVKPMLAVNDMNGTIRFYGEVLGFEFANRTEGWASLRKDAVEVMVSLPNAHEPFDKPTLTGSLYFSSDNVDALWRKLKNKTNDCLPD